MQDSLMTAALQWARDSVRSRGVVASGKYLAEQVGYLLRDMLPDRRRSRFGDLDFDFDHDVDTTWAKLPMRVRLREIFTERLYQATFPDEFGEMMEYLATVDFEEFTFIDLGSGKGRAVLLAAMYPFHECIGVEVQKGLHDVAESNIRRVLQEGSVAGHKLQCRSLVAECVDARYYEFPKAPLVLYLFNPFPSYVLEAVLDNLQHSLKESPREVYWIYNTPWERQYVDQRPWLKRMFETDKCVFYKAESA